MLKGLSSPEEVIAGIGEYSEENINDILWKGSKIPNYKWWYRALNIYVERTGDTSRTLFQKETYPFLYNFLKNINK